MLDAVSEPLPFPQPDRLVAIRTVPNDTSSIPTIQDWQRRSSSFQSIAAYRNWSPEVRSPLGSGGRVIEVSQNFLSTLGTSFEVGQDFVQTGNERDCLQQVVLSGRLWKQFGGGSDLAERTIELGRRTFRVVGVLPVAQTIEGPYALNHPDIFVPIGCNPNVRVRSGETQTSWFLGGYDARVFQSELPPPILRTRERTAWITRTCTAAPVSTDILPKSFHGSRWLPEPAQGPRFWSHSAHVDCCFSSPPLISRI